MDITREHLGLRLLVRDVLSKHCEEVTLLELSPSGDRVKFLWPSLVALWHSREEYILEEVLPRVEKTKRKVRRRKK
jgi:hypothetical protein